MALTLDQFIRLLPGSGLITEAEVQAFIEALPPEQRPQDAQQIARLLVRAKKLTAYQAQEIYKGVGKNLVLGNYVILDKLGQGGMGVVLKAEHKRMKRLVALKVLSPAFTKTPEALRRFQREVEAAAKLRHPNIVAADDADEAGGVHFLVMEYVEGSDLSALVKKSGPLPVEKALHCILQAARGLEYAHGEGVVHRDIKPANLLLDNKGTVKILDMGLARVEASAVAGGQADLTSAGQIMGTIDYMAPEQALNTRLADQRADVYSLGISLWYLVTGTVPYGGETLMEKLMAHQTKPIPSLRQVCPQVSPALEAVFTKMVAKTPETRYQNMIEVIADLEKCRTSEGSAPSVGSATGEESRLNQFLVSVQSANPPAGQSLPTTANSPQVSTAIQPRFHSTPPWWRHPLALMGLACGAGGILLLMAAIVVIVQSSLRKAVGTVNQYASNSEDGEQTPSSMVASVPGTYVFTDAGLPDRLSVKIIYNDVRPDGSVGLKEMREPTDGVWSIKNGELLLRSPNPIKNAVVSVPDEFESVQEVRIEGRTVQPPKSSLRITSGNVYIILNWEDANENHILVNGRRAGNTSPHVLSPNKPHDIAIKQVGEKVMVSVSGKEVFTANGRLATPINVGSSGSGVVGVKKIVVTGNPRTK